MTRIAAGTSTPNQPAIEGPPSRAASTDAATTVGSAAMPSRGAAADVGADRPAIQSDVGRGGAKTDPSTFLPMLRRLEGECRFMYVDTRGLVTTGIGHMIPNADAATKLPWHHASTGLPATPSEIRALFENLHASGAPFRGAHPASKNPSTAKDYEKLSDLVLPEGFPRQDALDRLRTEFLPQLREVFPELDSYPRPAQRAIVDMAYSLGTDKLRKTFPKFVSLCRAREFGKAAGESIRTSSRESRNAATQALLVEAERLKASVGTLAKELRP